MNTRSKLNRFLERRTGYVFTKATPRVDASVGGAVEQRNEPAYGSRRRTGKLPHPRLAPGEARTSGFFDDYPRFLTTSRTTPQLLRLNLRYDAIFGQNREIFEGASVLDIASHDGRWSFAALQTGASKVIGIEARSDLVEKANATFDEYGVDRDRFEFIDGDLFDTMEQSAPEVDVVLCLGFLYHTARYNELMRRIADCRPRYLVIDSRIIVSKRSIVFLRTEPVDQERNAVADRYSIGDRVLSGRPSAKAIETMIGAYGFDVVRYSDWSALLRDNECDDSVDVYAKGQRVTMLCEDRSKAGAPGR